MDNIEKYFFDFIPYKATCVLLTPYSYCLGSPTTYYVNTPRLSMELA